MTLDIFYEIIKEASLGCIEGYYKFNICFATYIRETSEFFKANIKNKNYLVPILIINDLDKFNSLLDDYLNKAYEFYMDDEYLKTIKDTYYKKKVLLSLLWSNATIHDFNNPEDYIKRRIDFFSNTFIGEVSFGYSSVLKSNLKCVFLKNDILTETPISIYIQTDSDKTLASIKFGISDDTIYIYGIEAGCKKDAYSIDDITHPNLLDFLSDGEASIDLFIFIFKNLGYVKFEKTLELPIRNNLKYVKSTLEGINNFTILEKKEISKANLENIKMFKKVSRHNDYLCLSDEYSLKLNIK